MRTDKDQWMEDVFHSMKGSQKARPSSDLFAKIERSIAESQNDNVISMHRFRFVAAAASLVLLVNVSALLLYFSQNQINNQASIENQESNNSYRESLISTFQIY